MLRCANLCALGQSKQRADVGAIQYSIHNAFISAICSTDYGTFVIAYLRSIWDAIQYSIHNAFISAICSTDYGTFVNAYLCTIWDAIHDAFISAHYQPYKYPIYLSIGRSE